MTINYNCLTKFRDGESWRRNCKTRKGALWQELKEINLGGEGGNVIRCGVLKLWERDEKCVRRLDSGEDLSCLVQKQTRRVLIN
jgi:hypothetical protein